VGSQFLNDYLDPATGPTAGGTEIEFADLAQSAKMTTVYLGGNSATSISQSSGEFDATTPAGAAGPADLYALMEDGGMLIVPEAFSYGPTILEVTPNASTAEGGGTGIVYGYGFGSTVDNSPIPTDLKILVNGIQVAVTGYAPNAYGILPPPFNLQAATFTIPPGTAGTSVDVIVSTQSGTATASAALQYIPAVRQFTLPGAALAQGIYDTKRDLYYFTDAAEIRVFSRSQGQWLTPMQVPAAPAGTTHRLLGIALSPDGSKLAVSDTGTATIYLINPDSPSSAQSFPISTYAAGFPLFYQGVTTHPAGLAISDAGNIYYAAFITGGDGYDGFFKLNTTNGTVKDYGIDSFGGDLYRVAITSDNSKTFFNNDGAVFSVDTATDAVSYAADDPGCCYGDYELTLSADQTGLEATSYLYDVNLNTESHLVLSDRDSLNITYVYGTKLSPDGALLFQPSTNGVDVFDGRLGTLRERISLPFALSQNFDALVSDGTDNVLIAITGQTGSGIAIIDFSSLSEPAPLPYLRAQSQPNSVSLEDNGLTGQQRLHRESIIQTGQRGPKTAIKHAVNDYLR
jgi:DNA-binding beta-propeller fold protein YncE